eukprot:SAG22_NODE_1001_length_6086_cov_3.870887_3_plen_155_part_00
MTRPKGGKNKAGGTKGGKNKAGSKAGGAHGGARAGAGRPKGSKNKAGSKAGGARAGAGRPAGGGGGKLTHAQKDALIGKLQRKVEEMEAESETLKATAQLRGRGAAPRSTRSSQDVLPPPALLPAPPMAQPGRPKKRRRAVCPPQPAVSILFKI